MIIFAMAKRLLVFVAVVGMYFLLFPASSAAKDFDYAYLSQSSFQNLNVPIGGKSDADLTLTIKNTGTKTWYKYGTGAPVVNLGPDPRDQTNWFACGGDGWVNKNRISMSSTVVRPGEQALFSFKVCPGNDTPIGKRKFYVTPVAEGFEWMGSSVIYWEINVTAPSPVTTTPTTKDLDYAYLSQSSYQNLNVQIGGKSDTDLTLTIKNTGAKTWYKSGTGTPEVNLGPDPRDQTNWFACSGDGWVNKNRISMSSNVVKPGEQALFSFKVCPSNDTPVGKRKFYVTPVAEGLGWMGSSVIFWEINVTAPPPVTTNPPTKDLDYAYLSQSSYQNLNVPIGGKSNENLTLTIKNTGTKTWYKSGTGTPSVNLGPDPRDQTNWFACGGDGWVNKNRISMDSNVVKPGEQALFKFKICPSQDTPVGKRKFYVTPVAEGLGWMGSSVIFWEVNVTPSQSVSNAPVLSWTGETNFVGDGLNPHNGGTNDVFVFRITYKDADGDAPLDGYPVLHILKKDGSELFSRKLDKANPGETNYRTGVVYKFANNVGYPGSYSYYFDAKDSKGNMAKTATLNGPDVTKSPTKDLDYAYLSQSSYQNLNVPIGGKSNENLTLTIKNTGTKTWYKSGKGTPEINLGPDPRDQTNWFACGGDGWVSKNRISMDSNVVKPGEQAQFKFKICPSQDTPVGKRKFYVTPVAEGLGWMGSSVIFWEVNVTPSQSVGNAPVLSWTGETNFVGDGLNPHSGGTNDVFVFRIMYKDADGDAPMDGYPVLHILKKDGTELFNRKLVKQNSSDTNYRAGVVYKFANNLGSPGSYSYYFEVKDSKGNLVKTDTLTGPDVAQTSISALPTLKKGKSCLWHVHSIKWSDGHETIVDISNKAKKYLVDCVFFSDHVDGNGFKNTSDFVNYQNEVNSQNVEGTFVTLAGREISLNKESSIDMNPMYYNCHINAFSKSPTPFPLPFYDQWNPQRSKPDTDKLISSKDIQWAIQQLNNEGALTIWNHPSQCKSWGGSTQLFNGIELFNELTGGSLDFDYYASSIQQGNRNIFVVSGADLHSHKNIDEFNSFPRDITWVFSDSLSQNGIISAVQNGNTIATRSVLKLWADLPPSRTSYKTGTQIQIVYNRPGYCMDAELYKDGKRKDRVVTSIVKDGCSLSFVGKDPGCYFLVIKDVLVTSPYCFSGGGW